MKYIVYCTTCLVNGKIYIGVHKTENPDEFDGYYGNGISKGYILKNPKTAFQRALKKYGYSNFKRAVLYVFDTEDEAYAKEEEIVNYDFVKRKDNYNTITGELHGECHKWIYRYHLDGSFWEEHLGINILSEKLGCNPASLRDACALKRSFKNSFWSYEKVDKINIVEYHLNKFSEIYQFDQDGNFIKKWESVKDICDYFNMSMSNILSALNKKTKAKNYYFCRDKDQIFNILKSKEVYAQLPKLRVGESRKIAQYDLNGNLIKIWPTIKECAKSYSKCRDVAKGLRKQTRGYTFKYIS